MSQEQWDNIPEEMRWTHQWLLAGPNEKGELKVPYTVRDGRPILGSIKVPSDWMDFETACDWARHFGYGIGFVLTKNDPFTCIDMDVKNQYNQPDPSLWTSQEQLDRFWKIVQVFDSYTEFSQSGQGLHTWLLGDIGAGCNHDRVEVYSHERFMACTGNILLRQPIKENQQMLELLVAEIRAQQGSGRGAALQLVELEEEEPDSVIIDRAINAANADKFNALCACTSTQGSGANAQLGSFTELGFKSQSEADLALLSMFTFYSKSNAQCRRLFRMTGLGQREKATKDNRYLDLTLQIIRTRQAKEAETEETTRAMAAEFVRELQAKQAAPQPIGAPQAIAAPNVTDNGLAWPPGLAGAIAWHIYQSSPRPVKEVAIVATLGFLAGVCGKAYQIPGSGLNLYIVLVARSAIGKEAMHSGIGAMLSELRESCPPVQRFVDFADFASGPALQKACAANTSFVNVSGEWGKKLKRLANEDSRDTAMQSLRTVMTNLYQKSGPTSVVGGLSYSNKEQNVASVSGVAYSMIGETTPSTFYESLTNDMMSDGFLSRFTIVEYNGNRPPLNENPVTKMEPALSGALHHLVVQSLTLLDRFNHCLVQVEASALAKLNEFNRFCDAEINGTLDESWRQMWNRAHLKVLRIAALLAVADNHLAPVIYPQHADWALDIIRRDIKMFRDRINSGDIGGGDMAREQKLVATIREYLSEGVSAGYNIPPDLIRAGIIPRKVLQIKCARVNAFSTHRNGANFALDSALKNLADSGYIIEVDKTKLLTEYKFHGKAFRVISLPSVK